MVRKLTKDLNIVLIGMPGVGKSTIGVLLAKYTSRNFLDTDVYLQTKEGRSLKEIIDQKGLAEFCRLEESCVLSLNCRGSVLATGGSVVYYPAAIDHLRSSGVIVHLSLDLPLLEKRLSNLNFRGVVMIPGQTLASLFSERTPLYRKYADFIVDCDGKTHEEVVADIMSGLKIGENHPSTVRSH